MATRRDLMDSYAFARRRLLTAFLRPNPNRTEENTPRHARSLTASGMIGVLMLLGLGVYGAFNKGTPHDWQNALIVDSATGSRYVLRPDNKLYPVLNLASARLLEDPNNFRVVDVPDSALAPQVRGQPIGIVGAPDSLPSAGDVQQSAWQVCAVQVVQAGGTVTTAPAFAPQTQVFIDDPAAGPALSPAEGMVVADARTHQLYLLQGGFRYLLESPTIPSAFDQAITGPSDVEQVGSSWLDQIPARGNVWFPQIPGRGKPAPAALRDEVPSSMARIGSFGTSTDANGTLHHYVLLSSGLMELTDFEYALVRSDPANNAAGTTQDIPIPASFAHAAASAQDQNAMLMDPQAAAPASGGSGAAGWPTSAPSVVNGPGGPTTLCVVPNGYDTTANETTVGLVAAATPPIALGPGDGARPVRVGSATADVVHVQQSKGALVQAVGSQGPGAGQIWLVTDTGVRYLVVPNATTSPGSSGGGQDTQSELDDTLTRLGYKGVTPIQLQFSFVNLLQTGPSLSVSDAGELHSPSQSVALAPSPPASPSATP